MTQIYTLETDTTSKIMNISIATKAF
jgi:hypothetical protein